MSTRICSYNVRGIGNKRKREQIFQWLKEHNHMICLLQETHLTSDKTTIWKNASNGPCFFQRKMFK